MWEEKEISIGEIESLLLTHEVEIYGADGYVPVSKFVDKGMWPEYLVSFDNGKTIRCNQDHLFESTTGWVSAQQILMMQDGLNHYPHFLCDGGLTRVVDTCLSGAVVPIVDIAIDHENHRYYADGISSHNTGVGKTLAMCHMAAANLIMGKNVLYITMEMAEERIAERIDANLLGIPLDELETIEKSIYDKKVAKVKGRTSGKLIIKEYPTAGAGANHFRHLLNELKLKKNFQPDIIYIDYLNICCSSRIKMGGSVNSYTYIKSIAEELRGLAIEQNVPIMTATQTNRSGQSDSDIDFENVSESHGLAMTLDLFLAVTTNDELLALGQIMFKQLKNRYSDVTMYKRFVVGCDRPRMRLYDVEQDAQEDVLDDKPVMSNSAFGQRDEEDASMPFLTRKAGKKDFSKLF